MKIKVGDESWPLVARPDIGMADLELLWSEAGLGIRDVMSGDLQNDPRLLRAFVWLARRADGEVNLKYADVDFKYYDLRFEGDPAEDVPAENPTQVTPDENGPDTSST